MPVKKCLQMSKFYSPVNGGIETTVRDISEGLVARGWHVDVLCANTNRFTRNDVVGSIQVTRTGSLGMVASTSISPMLIFDFFRRRDEYDVIHVHLPNPLANLALLLAPCRVKIVVHWHSDIVKQKFLLKLYKPLQSWLLRRANVIIATTDIYAQSSVWLKPHLAKVRLVPSCIEDPLCSMNIMEQMKWSENIKNKLEGKKIIFALGRMIYYKGFDVLIHSLRNLDDDIVVLLGGTGELLDYLKRLAKSLGVDQKIVFLGRVPDNELASYFLSCDVFCLPSLMRSEAFGLVMVEAMSFGKPVVATQIPGSGVNWVNRHGVTGLNAKPGDAVDLAACLQRLIQDPLLCQAMGAAGRKHFEENLTIEKMIDSTIAAYELE